MNIRFSLQLVAFLAAGLSLFGTGCAAEVEPELGQAEGALAAPPQGQPTSNWSNGSCQIWSNAAERWTPLPIATSQYECAYSGWWASSPDNSEFLSPCNKFQWACASY